MNYFHRELLETSIQQKPQGRLPQGLLAEVEEARELAKKFISDLGPGEPSKIDRRVYEDPNYLADDVAKKATQYGFYSLWLPKAIGGAGFHPLSMYGFNFEMGSYCLGVANVIGAHYVGLGLVSASNAFDVLKRITTDIRRAERSGKHCVVSAAITEPGAGSDLEDGELIWRAKVCTHAKKVDGGYVLNGQKIFISNSAFASWHVVSCFEDLNNPGASVAIMAVPGNAKGVSMGRTEKKLGQSASPASVLFFENVFVPDENVCFARSQFSSEKEYKSYADCLLSDVLALSRAGVGCMSAGVLKRTLEILVDYVDRSTHKGQSLSDFEWVQSQVGKVAQNFIVAKTLSWEGHVECYSRGPYKDLQKPSVYSMMKMTPAGVLQNTLGSFLATSAGRDKMRRLRLDNLSVRNEKMVAGWGSLVKGACSDLAVESVLLALDIVSSSGDSAYFELEKILRDTKLLQIYEGTNELNRLMNYKNFIGSAEQPQEIFRE